MPFTFQNNKADFKLKHPLKLKAWLSKIILSEKKKEGKIAVASVYFRDLNNGPWFGINIHESFAPVSLLKVPLMIGWLKKAESSPEVLQRKIRYVRPNSTIPEQTINPQKMIVPGETYSVEDLIRRMISHSDNQASDLLFTHMDQDWFRQTHKDLGIIAPYSEKPMDYITVKSYSSFFRVLYNASYLSREMSEKALDYLLASDYKDGLVAGLPPGTQVAHKFGEYEREDMNQLHDCGIVYYPRHPYILSVMTRGSDKQMMADTIAEISRLIYEEVDGKFGPGKRR
jgi:beta-lactamase class A